MFHNVQVSTKAKTMFCKMLEKYKRTSASDHVPSTIDRIPTVSPLEGRSTFRPAEIVHYVVVEENNVKSLSQ